VDGDGDALEIEIVDADVGGGAAASVCADLKSTPEGTPLSAVRL
jgi:hypothetical protein